MSEAHLAYSELREMLVVARHPSLDRVANSILEGAEEVTAAFYDAMLRSPATAQFLSHEIVKHRLRGTMANWLRSLFSIRTEDALVAFAERQQQVGEVHARVRVPIHLVSHGTRILRRELSRHVTAAGVPLDSTGEMHLVLADLLDYSMALINEAYLRHALRGEREALSLRDTLLGSEVALECERVRASLFDWARQRVCQIHGRRGAPVALQDSSVGAWLRFKAGFVVGEIAEIERIRIHVEALDENLSRLEHSPPDAVDELERVIPEIATELNKIAERMVARDVGRDTLTRLFNRRYLPTVLQRETQVSLMHGVPFSVAIVDVDRFKDINDRFGHAAGDVVLRGIAERFTNRIRTSDFLFRYGGEEFLAVLGGADAEAALALAQKIRADIAGAPFGFNDLEIRATVSIGVAGFDGHPDFARLVQRADMALYRAKEEGRDRCLLAEAGLSTRKESTRELAESHDVPVDP